MKEAAPTEAALLFTLLVECGFLCFECGKPDLQTLFGERVELLS